MKSRWSLAVLVILAGVLAVSLALSPSAALAKVFSNSGPPAFTVTYPDDWSQDSENPNRALLRTKKAGALPIMEIQCIDLPKGTTMATLANWLKTRYERSYQTDVAIGSSKPATLKDGTACSEVTLKWVYSGFLSLQTDIVATIKDGKMVYVAISHNQSDPNPMFDAPRSLIFKK